VIQLNNIIKYLCNERICTDIVIEHVLNISQDVKILILLNNLIFYLLL